jgi:hypothetical protein
VAHVFENFRPGSFAAHFSLAYLSKRSRKPHSISRAKIEGAHRMHTMLKTLVSKIAEMKFS